MSVVVVDHEGGARFCSYADPGIKLFGRDIPLTQESSEEPSIVPIVQCSSYQDDQPDSEASNKECKEPMDIVSCKSENLVCVDIGNKAMVSTSIKMDDTTVKNGASVRDPLTRAEEAQGPIALEKTPKKPDKVLPCPRCHSLDTKFCYFNNYNVNQPRHFCRKCQRYWTAGGTLRNVPIGAGRRKNKHSASHQKHSIGSDALQVRTSASDVARHRFCSTSAIASATLSSKPKLHVLPLNAQSIPTLDSPSANSSMLNFGQESPLCKSMAATTLGIQENAALQNPGGPHVDGTVAADVKYAIGSKHRSELEDCCSSVKILPPICQAGTSSATITAGVQLQEGELTRNADSGSHQMHVGEALSPAIHGPMWQPGSNIVSRSPFNLTTVTLPDSENSSTTSFSLPPPNVLACNGAPGGFWPGYTWPFMNPAMWGAPPLEWASPWTSPWTMPVYPPAAAAAAAAAAALLPISSAGSAPQKNQLLERSQPEKCLWVPKTLRIDDPLNAARSSIWTTLGLGDGPLSSPAHGSKNAFQGKVDFKEENEAVSTNRLSNPAALSRSVAFQENS